jgi:hypothetical protein
MKAIVIATKTGRCLPVLLESINQYVPDDVTVYLSGYDHILPNHRTITMPNDGDNFGDSYNAVVQKAFEEHDEIIVANDDIVLTPYSYLFLEQDIERLKDHLARIDVSPKLGWVASRSDYVREAQNIRFGKERHGDIQGPWDTRLGPLCTHQRPGKGRRHGLSCWGCGCRRWRGWRRWRRRGWGKWGVQWRPFFTPTLPQCHTLGTGSHTQCLCRAFL